MELERKAEKEKGTIKRKRINIKRKERNIANTEMIERKKRKEWK